MSVQAITAAFAFDAPSSNAKLVLLALANYADEDGVCYPSVKRLATMTGLSDRSVRYALQALVDAGAMDRNHRRRADGSRTSDEYRLHIPAANGAASEQEARPAASKPSKRQILHKQAARGAGLTTFEPSAEPKAITPQTPIGQLAALIFQLQPKDFRRSTRPDIAQALEAAVKRGGAKADIHAALKAYYALPDSRKEGGQYAKGAHRIINLDRWRDFLPSPEPPAKPVTPVEQARRLRHLADTGEWPDHWGARPQDRAA